jgi:hypothetical protein
MRSPGRDAKRTLALLPKQGKRKPSRTGVNPLVRKSRYSSGERTPDPRAISGRKGRFPNMMQNRPSRAQAVGMPPEAVSGSALNGKVLLFFMLVVLTASFFLTNAWRAPEDLTARFTIDDSFYYFETAWQTRLHGFVTFDGINRANGVHFLWFVVLLAMAFAAPSKMFILYGAYCISFVLVMAVYAAIWRIGTMVRDRSRLLTLLMALCWTFLLSDRGNLFFVGMESTPHMAVLVGCLIAFLALMQALDDPRRFPGRELLAFTVSLVLLTWVRLDSAIFSLFLYAYAIASLARRHGGHDARFRKYLVVSAAIAACGAIVQFGFFQAAGGTWLPISGLVKASGIGPAIAAGLWARYMSIVYPIPTFLYPPTPLQLAAELALFLALLCYAAVRAWMAPAPMRHLHGFAAALGAATAVYAPVIGAYHDPFWRWYLAPVYLFYILTVAAALREAGEAFSTKMGRIALLPGAAGAAALLLCGGLLFASYQPVPHYMARAQLGLILKRTTPESDILAAFNAGQLAFFSERRTINLDGLVNDYGFLRDVLGKPQALAAYLAEKNVRSVVDYDFYWADGIISDATTVRASFPILGDRLSRTLFVRDLAGK